jgi:hypothetical protein
MMVILVHASHAKLILSRLLAFVKYTVWENAPQWSFALNRSFSDVSIQFSNYTNLIKDFSKFLEETNCILHSTDNQYACKQLFLERGLILCLSNVCCCEMLINVFGYK